MRACAERSATPSILMATAIKMEHAQERMFKMAVMSHQVSAAFELAPNKRERFLRINSGEKASSKAIARANKYVAGNVQCAERLKHR